MSLKVMVVFVIVILLAPIELMADEIVLDNGNSFSGTVTNLVGEIVTIISDYAEPIKVKKSRIVKISTDNPVEIYFTNGGIIKGKLKTGDDGRILFYQKDGMAAYGIELKSISTINSETIERWHGSMSLSGNLQTGNTDRAGLSLGAEALHKRENDRITMRVLYNIAEEDSKMTTRNAYGVLKYDYLFTKKLYGYLGLELLNDDFKDLALRTVVGPGVGGQVWDDPIKFLSMEVGIVYFSEEFRSQEDRRWLTIRLAGNYWYKFNEWLKFSDRLVLYPSFKNISDFTLRNEAAFLSVLGSGWSLQFANILDYNNNPPVGIKSADSNFIVGLQYAY